jgi:hypothetical protein
MKKPTYQEQIEGFLKICGAESLQEIDEMIKYIHKETGKRPTFLLLPRFSILGLDIDFTPPGHAFGDSTMVGIDKGEQPEAKATEEVCMCPKCIASRTVN